VGVDWDQPGNGDGTAARPPSDIKPPADSFVFSNAVDASTPWFPDSVCNAVTTLNVYAHFVEQSDRAAAESERRDGADSHTFVSG
jgi:hypothetical protein